MTIDMADEKRKLGIYIHIPFCRSKCLYCDFCSKPSRDEERIAQYVKRLVQDIKDYKTDVDYAPADTVYFGGGTPTLMTGEQFSEILFAVRERFKIADGAEISSECNPRTVDSEKLEAMLAAGVNRLSIGMQSGIDEELKKLGRAHKFSDVADTVKMAREVGFSNISLDIMYGIPDQTKESLKETLIKAMGLSPEHLSLYALKIEEGTPFYKMQDKLTLPDDDTTADMYLEICDYLAKNEYNKYEISNFSKVGFESRHNLKYWKYDDYIGFGPSAHSFVDGVRIENSPLVDEYISGEDIVCSATRIEMAEQMNEYVMLSMRLATGVDVEIFKEKFGVDFFSAFGEKFKKFSPEFVRLENGSCTFTEKGFLVSNYILSECLQF